jgi:osmoprotectant transport system permease protein
MQDILRFIADPANDFAGKTWTYLQYCIYPTVLSIAIAVPLGIAVARVPVAAFVAANLSGLARAIPTLALLFFMLPILGFTFATPVTALTLLGIPPILLNTIAGLNGVDPAAVEAGRGMGMTRWQILTRVQVPLTLPVIAAGIRTSAVQIVATAPLATLIGGGGWGDYINEWFGTFNNTALLVGAGCIAILALIVEFGLAGVQRLVTPAGIRRTDLGPTSVPERPASTISAEGAAA